MKISTDSIDEFLEGVRAASKKLLTNFKPVEDVGLDPRSHPHGAWVADGWLVVRADDVRLMNYYGGFEYADITPQIVGDYAFYYESWDDRVQDCIDYVQENQK